jgi:hypothetical protein
MHNKILFLCSVLGLLVTTNVVTSSQILVTLMLEAIPYSQTLVLASATRHLISEDGILYRNSLETLNLT